MDKSYFIKHLFFGVLYLAVVSAAWFLNDDLFYRNSLWVIFMALSTLLYPFSRYFIQATAYRFRAPVFWKKALLVRYGPTTGIDALFSFACMMLAIPLGGSYFIYLIHKRRGDRSRLS
jgi:hypothetical protein